MESAKKIVTAIAVILLFALVFFSVWLLLFQHKLIYYPRPYLSSEVEAADKLQHVNYTTSQGKQTSFYVAPKSFGAPRTLWVLFSGNASLALNWLPFVRLYPDRDTGFLLIDYPGYGMNEGHPSPATIAESSDGALEELRSSLGGEDNFELNAMGHSLGAAACAAFAARHIRDAHPPKRVILLSPFTTMAAMARRVVGPLFVPLLRHRFDNIAEVQTLLSAPAVPQISIFHGTDDEVIPIALGKELAALDPARIAFREYPGAMHNTLLGDAKEDIFAAMLKTTAGPDSQSARE